MNKTYKQCHLKAIAENLELGLIGGVLASGIDSFWVVTDILNNGVNIRYIFILSTLLLSTFILSVSLIRHHKCNFKYQVGMVYASKKAVIKAKNKHFKKRK